MIPEESFSRENGYLSLCDDRLEETDDDDRFIVSSMLENWNRKNRSQP